MTMRLLIIAALTVGSDGFAQQLSHTPTLDKLEHSTGLLLKPTLTPVNRGSGELRYNPEQPLLYSLGTSTALYATFALLALYASSHVNSISGDCASYSPFSEPCRSILPDNGKEMPAADAYEERMKTVE